MKILSFSKKKQKQKNKKVKKILFILNYETTKILEHDNIHSREA